MKKSYNKLWDSYVQGQPGGNLPSGNQSEDALDYLLNGLYTTTAGNADNPLEEEDRYDDADNDADGGGGAGKQDDAGASSPEQIEVGRGAEQQDEEGAIETLESKADGSPGGGGGIKEEPDHGDNRDRGDDDSSEDREDAEGGFPDRPNNWIHPFLLTYCLIGRPSSSEDPDLKTARKTSGPKGRKGKLKSKQGSLNTSEKSGPKAHGAYTEVDLSSSAIRMFTGAGDSQSRVQVKETPAGDQFRQADGGRRSFVRGRCFEAGFGPRSRRQSWHKKKNRRSQGAVGSSHEESRG
ncbi:unnamed protein product [Ascophyllum nodosum]